MKLVFPLLISTAIAVGACSKPVLKIDEPSAELKDSAVEILTDATVAPPRNIRQSEMTATVNRVLGKVRESSHEVCMELALPTERCDEVKSADVTVHLHEDDPNAYADQDGNVGVHGGLVRISGTDAEIAAVLAHEFSHVMYGHVDRKEKNALVGMAVGGGLAAIFAANSGAHYDQQTTEDLMNVGFAVGSAAYSPEMEIEADRTAIYILERAGYPPTAMRDAIIRLGREDLKRRRMGIGAVGFLQTHPSDNRRIAHILSATQDLEAGAPLAVADY